MLSLLIITVSCENDDKTSVTSPNAPVLLNPANGDKFSLRPEKSTDLATTFVWNHAEYGVQTAVNYSVEFALAGTDFAVVIDGGSPFDNQKFKAYTVAELNQISTAAGLTPFADGDLDVRIKAWLGANVEMVSYSEPLTITINGFTDQLPTLAVPGNHQGWSPPTAPRIASSAFGETDYEGYIWLDGEFKFVGPDAEGVYDWNKGPDYGDDGSFSNILAEQNESNITVTPGYYWVKADTGLLTYSVTKTDWGVTGSATPNGWPDNGIQDHNMVYDATSKTWTATLALSVGELKFRANDAWLINYGDAEGDGVLDFNNGTNIQVTAAGTYIIKLNLSDPRNYTYTLSLQ